MPTLDPFVIAGPVLIVVADIIVYVAVGKLGTKSSGTGGKYQPFTGGEEQIPARGTYQSELFVFAALFMVVEAFALILAGSFASPTNFYPLLFLAGGGGVILVVTWWLMLVGGVRF
jgi:NADH:ubiquinone oxidoreductase subunit 3 (subunit A)